MAKVLRPQPDEAKLLAAWVRRAAEWHDEQAKRNDSHWQRSSHDHHVAHAAKARALADRLER